MRNANRYIISAVSGGAEPAKPIALAAFHIASDDGLFVVVVFTVPPHSDLINLLASQAKEKMDFGIKQGYIRNYLGLVTVNDDQFNGFYTKAIGKSGNVEMSGGLEHKKLKNTLIQLTLLCPQSWDQGKAENTLMVLLKSVALTTSKQFGVWQRFATNLATWPQLFDPEEIMDSILFAGSVID